MRFVAKVFIIVAHTHPLLYACALCEAPCHVRNVKMCLVLLLSNVAISRDLCKQS